MSFYDLRVAAEHDWFWARQRVVGHLWCSAPVRGGAVPFRSRWSVGNLEDQVDTPLEDAIDFWDMSGWEGS